MKVTCPILPLPKVGKLTLSRAPCCPQTFVLACAAVAAADITVKLVKRLYPDSSNLRFATGGSSGPSPRLQ
jgi:hypothetical protein